ncbi:MAG: sulfatase-like hydrolase/transferase [Fimbriimonadaceae bacterium]|nr:sulfatase-like hydrolase/transferase [Fimbriimonadaceae bacterium]
MADRPNVLFVLTDDQRFDTVGALGNPHLSTPTLDGLVRRGYAFEKQFCTTPICTPARAEILTGCTSFGNHVPWFGMPINPALTLLPQAFQQAGYHTVHVGKWHNDGHPRDKGYDRVRRVFHNDNRHDYQRWGHQMRFAEESGEVVGHSTELFTAAALEELAAAPTDRPWFCYLAYHAPHDPHDSPAPFDTLYDPATLPPVANWCPEHPFDNGDLVIRDERLAPWPRTDALLRRYRARYYGLISHLDYHLGRVLGRLAADGSLDRTIVVFTGDQGLAIGSHGLLGKESMYDHSIASPLILAGPGIPAGGRSAALSHHVDLFPTLCELTGLARPASAADGHSLVPLLHGRVDRVREHTLCEFYSPEQPGEPLRHTQRCLRTERWKLGWYPLVGRYTLHDLQHDALEQVDLLRPWRRRLRLAEEQGGKSWRPDPWAERGTAPAYREADIAAVASDLHARLIAEMRRLADPLLSAGYPPPPGLER